MSVEVTFELPYTQWDWQVAVYVALLGLAGGAYLTAYVADVLSHRLNAPEYGRLASSGYLIGLAGILIGPPILLSHLATPFRAMLVPLSMTNFGSWMTIGAYMLGGLAVGTVLMFAWTSFGKARPSAPEVATDGGSAKAATGDRTVGGVRGIVSRVGLLDTIDTVADTTRPSGPARLGLGAFFGLFAAGVLVYSAMALGSGPYDRVPLWDKTFLLPVQIFSGLGAGLVAAVGLTAVTERSLGRELQTAALSGAGLLVLALIALVVTVLALPAQVPEAQSGVDNLVGSYAWLFVGVGVVVGVVVPIALTAGAALGQRRDALAPSGATTAYALAAVCVIVGKVALTLSYLLAGEFTPIVLPM